MAWTEARGAVALPVTSELAAAFLAELAEEGLSVATLRLQKAALAKVHRSAGHQDTTDNEGLKRVMAGIARANGRPQRQAKPLTAEALAAVFGLSASQIGRRIDAAAKAAGLGEGFTGHSGRVGMAQDLAASGVELPELMTAGRWKSSRMPARYTERQTAGRGAVARYYQGRRG